MKKRKRKKEEEGQEEQNGKKHKSLGRERSYTERKTLPRGARSSALETDDENNRRSRNNKNLVGHNCPARKADVSSPAHVNNTGPEKPPFLAKRNWRNSLTPEVYSISFSPYPLEMT